MIAARAHTSAPETVGQGCWHRKRYQAAGGCSQAPQTELADEVAAAETWSGTNPRRRDDAASCCAWRDCPRRSTALCRPRRTRGTIRARLASVEEALADAAVDPKLHEQVQTNPPAPVEPERPARRRPRPAASSERFAAATAPPPDRARRIHRGCHPEGKRTPARSTPEPGRQRSYQRGVTGVWWRTLLGSLVPDFDGIPAAGLVATVDDADRFAGSSMHSLPSCSHAAVRGNAWPKAE